MILEENADFRNDRLPVGMARSGNLDAGQKIFFSIRAQYTDGKLRTGENNRLTQSFEHKAKGRGGISHRIRAMQNYKTGIMIVIVTDNVYEFAPRIRVHVRRIHWRIELISIYTESIPLKFGHMFLQLLEVEVL